MPAAWYTVIDNKKTECGMDEQELDPAIAALLAEAEKSHRIGEEEIDTAEPDNVPEA